MKRYQLLKKNRWILGMLVGAAVFCAIYGTRTLNPLYDAWIFNDYIETDIVQRYAGWLAYRHGETLLPPGWSGLINYPFGDYTGLADSIPLAEVLFRLLAPVLPDPFQFCGLLCLFNLMLQGSCAVLLVEVFCDDGFCCLLGSGLFCLSPVLLERLFRHTSLSFHWLLLLAIRQYFLIRRDHCCRRFWLMAALAVASVWLHLYFTPLLLGFLLAAVLDEAVHGHRGPGPVGAFCAAVVCAVLSAHWLGLLGIGLENTSGYGTMGMNLNALFNPVSLGENWWIPQQGQIHWSRFLPIRALAQNNLESFNYLGLGVLLVLDIECLWLLIRFLKDPAGGKKTVFNFLKRYPFLLLFCLASTLFAVSNEVCAFSYVLVRIPLPEGLLHLCSAFRASGRLFWGNYYLLFLFAVVAALRLVPKKRGWAGLALTAVVLVQALDLSPALLQKHTRFMTAETYRRQAQADAIIEACGESRTLYFLEEYGDRALCGQLLRQGIANNLLLIGRGDYGIQQQQAEMERVKQALLAGELPYESCAYATGDRALAQQLAGLGEWVHVGNYFLCCPGPAEP